MRWKAKYVAPEPVLGSTRLKRVFAFLPQRIGDIWVWLEVYEVLQVYKPVIREIVTLSGEELEFTVNKWVAISKKLWS